MGVYKDKVEYLLKHNLAIQKLYKVTMSAIFRLAGLFLKTEDNLVLINAFGGKKYGDSSKSLYDYLRSHQEYSHLRIVWAFDHPERHDTGCEKVKQDSWAYFRTALKAKYWITCVNIERGLKFKKKATRYLNTWHGTPLKYIGNDVAGRKDYDCSNIDLFCYAGPFEYDLYQRAFNVPAGAMLLSGLPRNDELYHVTPQQKMDIRIKLGIPHGKKVIMYAPTWRDSVDGGKSYVIAPPMDLGKWEERLGQEWILLFRAHHFTTKQMGVKFNDFVRDMSAYPSINELMIASDILISDYSATIFDYSILKRPIISFAYDYEEYRSTRGLYLDLEQSLPGGILRTEDEVLDKVQHMDYEAECRATAAFKQKYLPVGGNATEMCIRNLFGSQQKDA